MIQLMEFLLWLSELQTQLVSMRFGVQSLALLSGLKIWRCHELWCRSQTWLGSGVAVTGAGWQLPLGSDPQTENLHVLQARP